MDEARKTNLIRGSEFFKKYLTGKVIDIGAGRDLVCEWAERFDKEDGDANQITKYRRLNTYDAVHSSHCLEHMYNPKDALQDWWSLVKPGGHLILVVPDEDLYEQGFWPSRFNGDHKATFRLTKEKSWSPVSYDILDLASTLPNAEVISAEIQDKNYNYKLQTKYPPPQIKPPSIPFRVIRKICRRMPFARATLDRAIENWAFRSQNVPIDQTLRDAVAQIQVVARKRNN